MGKFTREECIYNNFIIKPKQTITFLGDENSRDITISVPIKEDTPQCIKDKLNEVLWENMNKYMDGLGYFGCMYKPCNCLLNARMEIIYDWELGVQYYLVFEVKEAEGYYRDTYFDNRVLVSTEEHELYNEFVAYCRYKLDKILFPY